MRSQDRQMLWMWKMHPSATEDEIKNAIEELQDKWEPTIDDSVSYEWVTEQIDGKFLALEVKIEQLQEEIKVLRKITMDNKRRLEDV